MIDIADWTPVWATAFEAEAARLRVALGPLALRIDHVGSTAVRGLAAKPVVDIQVSVASLDQARARYDPLLAGPGYRHVPDPVDGFDQRYPFYRKPADGTSTHHVHLCVAGSAEERRHLAFRDWLRSHPADAADYAALKRSLALRHDGATPASRDAYTRDKGAFVASILVRALPDLVALVPCDASRIDALVPMWRASFEGGVGIVDPHPLSAQRDYFVNEVLARNDVRVATIGGELCGFVAATRESIAQLYVRVGFQRRGIGAAMLRWAKAQSRGSLWLYTFARNRGARAFYERHGFRAVAFGFEPTWQLDDVRYEWSAGAGTLADT